MTRGRAGRDWNAERTLEEFRAAREGDGTAWLREAAERHLEAEPEHQPARYSLARACQDLALHDEAEAHLERLESLASDGAVLARVHGARAMGAWLRGDVARAEEAFGRCFALAPRREPEWECWIELLVENGRVEEAEAACRDHVEATGASTALAHGVLGEVLRVRDAYAKARAAFERACRLDPDEPRWEQGLSDVREAEAVAFGPAETDTDLARARYEAWGELERPASLLEEFLRLERAGAEGFADNAVRKADALLEVGRLDEARAVLDAARPRRPANRRIVACWAGHVEQARKRYAPAVEHYRAAIAASDDPREHASPHVYLGGTFAVQGRFEEARACHEAALECREGAFDEAYYNLGLIARAERRYEDALVCFDRALALDPAYEIAREARLDVERALAVRG